MADTVVLPIASGFDLYVSVYDLVEYENQCPWQTLYCSTMMHQQRMLLD